MNTSIGDSRVGVGVPVMVRLGLVGKGDGLRREALLDVELG